MIFKKISKGNGKRQKSIKIYACFFLPTTIHNIVAWRGIVNNAMFLITTWPTLKRKRFPKSVSAVSIITPWTFLMYVNTHMTKEETIIFFCLFVLLFRLLVWFFVYSRRNMDGTGKIHCIFCIYLHGIFCTIHECLPVKQRRGGGGCVNNCAYCDLQTSFVSRVWLLRQVKKKLLFWQQSHNQNKSWFDWKDTEHRII